MPRKARKTQKPPLLFAEPPRGGARNRNEPEVRAALNPKSFITEGQSSHDGSTLTTWVSPQFDTVHLAALPARRSRRQCHSVTGITDRSTQLTRKKKSVCQYPSLSFKRPRDQSHQPDHARGKKATEPPVVSIPEQQQRGSRQVSRTASSHRAQHIETPKRSCSTLRKRSVEDPGLNDGASCSSRCLERHDAPTVHLTAKRRIPAFSASSPPTAESCTPDVSAILSPPDVDTPEVLHEEGRSPSSTFLHIMFSSSELSTSACNQPCDILVADTPERDYGVKVTWRRRRELMMMLKQRGSLSDADVLIDC